MAKNSLNTLHRSTCQLKYANLMSLKSFKITIQTPSLADCENAMGSLQRSPNVLQAFSRKKTDKSKKIDILVVAIIILRQNWGQIVSE